MLAAEVHRISDACRESAPLEHAAPTSDSLSGRPNAPACGQLITDEPLCCLAGAGSDHLRWRGRDACRAEAFGRIFHAVTPVPRDAAATAPYSQAALARAFAGRKVAVCGGGGSGGELLRIAVRLKLRGFCVTWETLAFADLAGAAHGAAAIAVILVGRSIFLQRGRCRSYLAEGASTSDQANWALAGPRMTVVARLLRRTL
eukprot:7390016-Prymnesium_polylepis.1